MRYSDYRKAIENSATAFFKSIDAQVNEKSPYILKNREEWKRNLIDVKVWEGIVQKKNDAGGAQPFALHKYIHHGLSSQAMLFNLFGPFVFHGNLLGLKNVLENCSISVPNGTLSGEFELVNRTVFNENQGQPTSIDFVIKGGQDGGNPLFIEAKFSEREFGSCSIFLRGDCAGKNPVGQSGYCYLQEVAQRNYWQLLKKHGFLTGDFVTSPICVLANYYQFFREMLFALELGGDFILLYDERNPAFVHPLGGGLISFLEGFIPDSHKARFKPLTIQKFVFEAAKLDLNWIQIFKRKYGIQ